MTAAPRRVLVVTHAGRPEARAAGIDVATQLMAAGLAVRVPEPHDPALSSLGPVPGVEVVPGDDQAADGCELVVVIGGDGTLLRGAELARHGQVPVLGVNLGHVGFLAEAEAEDLHAVVERVVERRYTVEERMSLDVVLVRDGAVMAREWALNEASVEKASRGRMLEVIAEVDGRPVSRWGCDGVVCATPTGSTAYAFSAGGPIVWPEVQALLMVPISAHALFARPMVASPDSVLAVEVVGAGRGILWCDGRRSHDLGAGDRVEVRRGAQPVRLARLYTAPFANRLVAKFVLPVEGWRGQARPASPPLEPSEALPSQGLQAEGAPSEGPG